MRQIKDIFRSERLMFIRIENDERFNKFFDDLSNDPYELNSNASLPDGYSQAQRNSWRDGTGKSNFLHHYICLPPTSPPPAPPPTSQATEPTAESSVPPAAAAATTTTTASSSPAPQPTPIGYLSLSRLPEAYAQHSRGSLSINLAPAHHGRGYGGEALRWALWWAFSMARLHKVCIGCFAWNAGALRLYRRLGFVLEGTLRDDVWFMGAWHDAYELGMLEHEWREMERARARERGGEGEGVVGEEEEELNSRTIARIMGSE